MDEQILIYAAILVAVIVLTIVGILSRYRKCKSDEVLVVYGKTGDKKSAKLYHGGAAFVWPIIQGYSFLNMKPMQIDCKLTGAISKSNAVCIFINQLREKVGVIYGNPEVTPGGRALKFYSSVRIEVRKAEAIKSGTDVIGNRTRAKVVKNKIAPPFRTAEFDVMYGTGISRTGELLDIAVKLEIIQKAGAWFSYNGERIGQGRDNSKEFLATHPELADEIEQKVRENGDKLYDKLPGRPAPREAAKPVELPPAEAPAQQPLTPPANKAAAKKSIDITVDDDD